MVNIHYGSFFILGDLPANVEVGTYDYYLVALSYFIAVAGSYTGLNSASNMFMATSSRASKVYHFLGALSFGFGIWSMHFIAMLAYKMKMAVSYDPYITILSLLIAIFIAYGVLQTIRSSVLRVKKIILSSLMLGFSICAMHYTGMAAMKMDADLYYIPSLFFLSVIIAIAASGAALWIIFTLGQHTGRWKLLWQILAALIMGLAICGMHYTGMAASVFVPYADCRYLLNQNFDVLAISVASSCFFIFTLAIVSGFFQSASKMEKLASLLKVDEAIFKRNIGMQIFRQLSILLALLFVLFLVPFMHVIKVQHQKSNDIAIINGAGLQRMLVERYTREITAAIAAHAIEDWNEVISNKKASSKTDKIVTDNFAAFLKGGNIILNVQNIRYYTINPLSYSDAVEAIVKANKEWEELKRISIVTLQSDASSIVKNPQYENLSIQARKSIEAQDQAVSAIEEAILQYTHKVILIQKIALAASFICSFVILAYVYFRISLPVGFLYRKLQENRENLEKRVADQTYELRRINEQMQVYTDKLEEARLEAYEEKDKAEKASQAKSEFLANMSHELRTPLNSIIGLSKILAEEAKGSSEEQDMNIIVHKSASHLLDIVNDILDLSKIEAGGMKLERIGFDLGYIVSLVLESLSTAASSKGIALNFGYKDKATLPYLIGDPIRVRRILTNLVGNAIKYTKQGSVKINIDHALLDDNKIQISCSVIDTGIGIPQDKLEVIFEKFAQVDETITRKYGGTGLGLAITKELVDMMGGAIGVESKLGTGTKFWFSIPFDITDTLHEDIKADKSFAEISDNTGAKIDASEAKILVAEDYNLNQIFLKKLLLRIGFVNIDIVENGQAAIDAYKKTSYDMILMDCHMPEKNGYQAAYEIRALEKIKGGNLPIIALTADAMAGTKEKCLSAGMIDYITKPINSDHFMAVLSTFFDIRDKREREVKTSSDDNENIIIDPASLNDYADSYEEKEEFCQIFFSSTEEALNQLEKLCISGKNHEWVEISHKIKGSSGMIGATALQQICAQSQGMAEATGAERDSVFQKIKITYFNTKDVLNKMLANEKLNS